MGVAWKRALQAGGGLTVKAVTGAAYMFACCREGCHTYSGFSSDRTSLSPFTKDFREGEHLRVKPIFVRLRHMS